jgi:hypothetical protein
MNCGGNSFSKLGRCFCSELGVCSRAVEKARGMTNRFGNFFLHVLLFGTSVMMSWGTRNN